MMPVVESTWNGLPLPGDWGFPILTISNPDWSSYLVVGYGRLIEIADACRHDVLFAQAWGRLLVQFDAGGEPATLDIANERWRRFVAGVWWEAEQFLARRTQAEAAARRLRNGKPNG